MKVTLFDFTGCGTSDPASYAAAILLYTKSTRLKMTPDLIEEFKTSHWQHNFDELKAMANTNPGSWEFIDLSFLIESATRAFEQQLTRTRTASYAIQSLRVVDISEKFEYATGPSIQGNKMLIGSYNNTMDNTAQCYKHLIKSGARIEDARGVLPLNILSNINIKIDMRNFINLARKRKSLRVQDEYRKFVDLAVIEVEKVYPWFYVFYKMDQMQAFNDLFEMIMDNRALSHEEKTEMFKKLDIIKGEL